MIKGLSEGESFQYTPCELGLATEGIRKTVIVIL